MRSAPPSPPAPSSVPAREPGTASPGRRGPRRPGVWLLGAAALLSSACQRPHQDLSAQLAGVDALAADMAALQKSSYAADAQVIDSLAVEAFPVDVTEARGQTPFVTHACGVRYRLPDGAWGSVPRTTFDCKDARAREAALARAKWELKRELGVAADATEAELMAQQLPRTLAAALGPVTTRLTILDRGFDLLSCVADARARLERSALAEAEGDCAAFGAPGERLAQFRRDLRAAQEVARKRLRVPSIRMARPLTPEQVEACKASTGSSGFEVPFLWWSETWASSAAYRVEALEGEKISLYAKVFGGPTRLEVRDSTCAKTLAEDGPVGGMADAEFTASEDGEYVVIARNADGGAIYLYGLGIVPPVGVSFATRAQLEELVRWVDAADEATMEVAWRASLGGESQLSCLNRLRFRNPDVLRLSSAWAALRTCGALVEPATATAVGSDDDTAEPIPVAENDPALGSREAPVTVVHFGDYTAPESARLDRALQALQEKYGPETIRLVWKQRPDPLRPFSTAAALAAATVLENGGVGPYWRFHRLALASQDRISLETLELWAREVGLKDEVYTAGFSSVAVRERVEREAALSVRLGAIGAPALRVNGVPIEAGADADQIEGVVVSQLAAARAWLDRGAPPASLYPRLCRAAMQRSPFDQILSGGGG